MTTAGSGGSGMEFGSDYVAARLALDVPEGSAQAIREITQEVERYHTTLEAAVRSEADFTRYMDQMAEASRKATEAMAGQIQQLQVFTQLASRGQAVPPSTQVPLGPAVQPFSGMSAGMAAPGARVPNPSDVAYQIASQAQSHPREYLNMQAARGNMTAADMMSINPESIAELANKIAERERVVRDQQNKTDGNTDSKASSGGGGPEDPYSGIQQRIARATSLAGQVMNEMGPGGSVMGMGSLALRGLNWARRRSSAAVGRGGDMQAEAVSSIPPEEGYSATLPPHNLDEDADTSEEEGTFGLSRVVKMLGPIGAVAGAALSAFGIIQKGGGMIQGMRNVASVRGGAAGEGAQVEFKARMMAMNPFISQDQARQIYQAVMSEGYADASGAGADNVIDFMKHNLTTMNMSVADSAKMLRSIIVGSGEGDKNSVNNAVASLGKELDTIRTLSREGVLSQPDYRAGVARTQEALMAAGAPPEEAMRSAMAAEQVGSDDQVMRGQFGRISASMAQDRNGMFLRMFGGPGGTALQGLDPRLLPQVTAQALEEKGGDSYNQAVLNALQAQARLSAVGGPEENQVYVFQQRLKMMGLDTDATTNRSTARKLFEEVRSGKEGEELQKAEQEIAGQMPSGGGGGGGGGRTEVSGNVKIDLTPQAAQLLQVVGGNNAKLTKTQAGANMGLAGYQVNAPRPGDD